MLQSIRRIRQLISLFTMMAQDAPPRPGMAVALFAAFLSLTVPALLAPQPAQAQLQLIDPTLSAYSTAHGWINTATGIARGIFGTLIVLEFTFFGIQFALFRDNLTDILGSMALKIITTGFFLWLIGQANTLFPAIIDSFTSSANQMTGPLGAYGSIGLLAGEIFGACAMIYGSATTVQMKQQLASWFSGMFVWGSGFAGQANGVPVAGSTNILLEQLISFLLISSLAVILMQWVITNIESYIVMFGGIIFLGFTGSRWTMPFAQGYLSYAVNVGAKLFTLYLVLAIEAKLGFNVLAPVALSTYLISQDPTGAAGPLNIAILFWASIQVAIMTAVAYAIPNITGSFLSGQSSMSGAQALSTMTSAMAGIRAANAAANTANNFGKKEAVIDQQRAAMQAAGAAPSAHHTPDPTMAPSQNVSPIGNLTNESSPNADAGPPVRSATVGQNGTLLSVAGGTGSAGAGVSPGGNADAPPPNRAPGTGQNGTLLSGVHGTPSAATPPPRTPAGTNASSQSEPGLNVPTSLESPAGDIRSPGSADNTAAASALPPSRTSAGFAPPGSLNSSSTSGYSPPPIGGNPALATSAAAMNATQNGGSGSSSTAPGIDRDHPETATPEQGRASVGRDPLQDLSHNQWNAIPERTREAMIEEMDNQRDTLEGQKEQAEAYAQQLLAQSLPRDGAPPTAVQVRLSSPDKL